MKKKDMLPALFFVFSRKNCGIFSNLVEACLNSPEEQAEVEKIINYN